MKIQNPHDKFFKETFSNVAVAKDFMNNYLPQSIINIIDINTLEPQKDSFINEELQEVFSDMLFRVNINKREGYIYFLFEHKSYTSKNISFQLLKYMLEIWEAKVKKEDTNELPVVIPLVIYHGKDKWNIKTSLGEMIKGYEDLPEDIEDIIEKVESTYPEGSEVVMTLAEQFREEGIIKGIEVGMEKGAKQRAINVARKLLKMNMSVEQVVDATDLTKKEVEEIKEELNA
jgi:predicted transposase YdaD